MLLPLRLNLNRALIDAGVVARKDEELLRKIVQAIAPHAFTILKRKR